MTAEEQGLLASQYYASNPIYPLTKTLAAINIDGMNLWGRTRDITVVGMVLWPRPPVCYSLPATAEPRG